MSPLHMRLLFALFAVSGFTGLIYESMWSHYLKLFLGAAAFAQSFVLGMFMGGMALGAWLASRVALRLRMPLALYAALEALIGIAALGFHDAYLALTSLSFDRVFPALASPTGVEVYKYALCTLLIAPQTVLLGMTFPLMSTAILRRDPAHSGHHLAMLYFTNSIGAALGALATAFLLLGWLGMPGTMRAAGALNLTLAATVMFLSYRDRHEIVPALARAPATPRTREVTRLFLAGAFVTGAASFIYEIVWIRMLSLVLGTSFQAFELMLSAFITGLALGGLWIRKRIDMLEDPVRYAGLIQLAMGLCALGTIFVYHETFDWMAWGLSVLQKTEAAYPLFNMFSHAIAFAVMLPATFLAGMTLPLFTHVLIRNGSGEKAIGQVYAANTVGAIVGVLIAVHVLIPETGAKLTLIIGAAADILLGGWLLRSCGSAWKRAQAFTAIIVGMLAATATARADVLSPERLASGVYRYGKVTVDGGRVSYYRDGKTASVAVRNTGTAVSIVTNGKPDASINLDMNSPPREDEYTMTLLGALPLLAKPDAARFANIGFGSGLTAEVILSHGAPRSLETIEIEPAMVAGARSFFPRVIRPYRDGRSTVHFEDAKSYFARRHALYDVIVSEPSNPWVNGVASLFTTEFYRDSKRYLAPGGIFVQWLQLYEFDDHLVASVLAAIGENFADYEVYEANDGDLVIMAVVQGTVPEPRALPRNQTIFMDQLARIGVTELEHVTARSMGTKRDLQWLHGAPNSDFRPRVQLDAARARYMASVARGMHQLAGAPIPILELSGAERHYIKHAVPMQVQGTSLQAQSAALEFAAQLTRAPGAYLSSARPVAGIAARLREAGALCGRPVSPAVLEALQQAAELTLANLSPSARVALWMDNSWTRCGSRAPSQEVQTRLAVYRAIAHGDARLMLKLSTDALRDTRTIESAPWWGRFLLVTALTGAHVLGNVEEGQKLWRAYGPALYAGDIPPAYLLHLASSGE